MKLLLLSDPDSAHTIKWANKLSEKGFKVFIWGLSDYDVSSYRSDVEIYSAKIKSSTFDKNTKYFEKIIYLKSLKGLREYIHKIKPDIVHAHYATSYGLLGMLTRFKPFIISVWGSDVYNFPRFSFIHRILFQTIINYADVILSTSEIMKREVRKYTSKRIEVTPFGIDLNTFSPSPDENGPLVIGTVKSLEKKYGTEYLIRAFKLIKEKHAELPVSLLIVGKGSQETYLKNLTRELNIEQDVHFTGYIQPKEIPEYHHRLTLPVFLSIEESESFGVSAVEASACGKPVIASRISGYEEVIENNVTGLLVNPHDSADAASAIEKLLFDADLRKRLGRNGRERVEKLYDLDNNADKMISIYCEFVKS